MENKLNCPVCGETICFEVEALVSGQKFQCTGCDAVISINEQQKDIVKNALKQLDDLKGISRQ